MRKRNCLLILIVLTVLLLSSCAQTRSVFMGFISGKPSWYYYPESRAEKGRLAFVGEGKSSENSRQGQLMAYNNLFSKLEEYVGTTLKKEYYRELTTLGTIEELGVREVDTYVDMEDGVSSVYVLCTASEEILNNMRTEARQQEISIASRVVALVEQGDQYIKESRDLSAVKCYLQSMALSYGVSSIKDGYDYDSIAEEVLKILPGFSLTVMDEDTKAVTCTVLVERRETVLKTIVKMGEIIASYTCLDRTGNTWQDSYVFTSSTEGTFRFRSVNYTLINEGEIVFSFNLKDEIENLKAVDPEMAEKIQAIVDEKSVKFSYDSSGADEEMLGLFVLNYDFNREYLNDDTWSKYIQERFTSDSITTFVPNRYSMRLMDSEISLTDSYLFPFITSDAVTSVMIVRMGPLEIVKSETGVTVCVVEGKAVFYSSLNATAIHESPILNVSGFGDTEEEALNNACRNLCNIIYDWFKGNYVQ